MLANPSQKYRAFPVVNLPDRQWPSRTLTHAPIWLSTDLRDGNQALFEPMNRERKLRLFQELVRIGFKEIEVGFPSASQTDYEIVRHLIDTHLIPDDVTPMVITQLREDLIATTVESVAGARRVIVHLYNAIAPAFREIVFGMVNRPGFCRQSRASYFLSNRSQYEQSTLPRRIQDRGGQTNP